MDSRLKWSIPDTKKDGSAWSEAERELALQIAQGCEYVGMSGIFNGMAAHEYLFRAVTLDFAGMWPANRTLRAADIYQFVGLRTNATKLARPTFLAKVSQYLTQINMLQTDNMLLNATALHEATENTVARIAKHRPPILKLETGLHGVGCRCSFPGVRERGCPAATSGKRPQ